MGSEVYSYPIPQPVPHVNGHSAVSAAPSAREPVDGLFVGRAHDPDARDDAVAAVDGDVAPADAREPRAVAEGAERGERADGRMDDVAEDGRLGDAEDEMVARRLVRLRARRRRRRSCPNGRPLRQSRRRAPDHARGR